MTIDLYVPNDWATTGRRMAGFWGTAFDAGDAVSAYPIIEFTSSSDGSGLPRFRGWNDAAGWVDMGLPTGFTYDAWYTLEIELVGSSFVYTVGDLTLAVSALGSARLGNVILQGHNTSSGVTYDIYWDNFVAAQMTMAVDNCDPAPVVTYSDVETPGSCPQEKTITRTWTATDACGNSSSCAQTITVQDTTAPVISCPDDFTVECEDDVPAAYADLAAFLAAGGTADDNCDTDLTLSLTSDTGLVGGICGGTVTRVYRVTDDCGNHHECSQEITVDDTIAPVITCPDDVVVNADAGGCDAIVDLGGKRCFGDYTFHSSYGAGHFDDVFDLTRYDVTLTYSIDLSQVTQTAAYETPYAEVGLRQVGAGDFNPGPWDTYQGGAGGWMTSLVGDLATNPNLLDLDDKHNLGASGGRGESDYDVYASAPSVVVAPPFGSFNTRYIWFDRDGVDPYQDTKGANSGGTYDITIRYHAINAGLGTMIATINGNGVDTVHQEFLGGGSYYPGGLSFKGNIPQMQLFYGAWYTGGAGGPVTVSNMCLTASARATDNCDPNPAITAVRSDSLPLTDPYPSGVTTITWTATDACGNSASCDQTVTVVAQNELVVDVQLKNVYEPTLTRCITFELFDCSGAGSVVVSQDITFTTGLATGVSILVPCGDYDCITARDVLHTLRRTDDDGDFGISGSQYVADFTSSGVSDDSLIGGNLNDDEYIDILDFGTFSWQWNVNYGTGDTTCSTAAPHADISGNGVVFTEDFSFIQTNFLTFREPNCCSLPGKKVAAGAEGPTTEISVAELRQRGLGYLAVADLNGDGWLDVDDVAAFQQGVRPKPTPGVLEQEAVELPAAMEAVPQGAAAPRSSGGRR